MRKFFAICRGASQERFRVNLFLQGSKTLIIERCEKKAVLHAKNRGGHSRAYGKNFEHACVHEPPGLTDSECHHRVIQYDFGELSCAVRFEVDACKGSLGGANIQVPVPGEDGNVQPAMRVSANPSMKLIRRGVVDPRVPLVELKSSKHHRKPLNSILPQLWFGRTAYLIRGIHKGGVFSALHHTDVTADGGFEA